MNPEQPTRPQQDRTEHENTKDQLLAILAHDIRNPLAAVVNGVQVLRQSGITGPLAEQTLDLIDRQLKRVTRLLDDSLQPAPRTESIEGEAPAGLLPSKKAHSGSLKLLVVEDNRDVAKSLTSMLRLWGHEVYVAYDGVHALRAADLNCPQVVLLDLDLPDLDGCTVARRIKASSASRHARLIAVTASGDEDYRRRVREAGFDSHMVKPVAPSALRQLLASLETNGVK